MVLPLLYRGIPILSELSVFPLFSSTPLERHSLGMGELSLNKTLIQWNLFNFNINDSSWCFEILFAWNYLQLNFYYCLDSTRKIIVYYYNLDSMKPWFDETARFLQPWSIETLIQ